MCNIAGIDIASRKFDYRIIDGNGASLSRGSCEMNLYGFSSFLRTVPEDTVFIMESTGRYHKNLCHFLIGKGFSVCVENRTGSDSESSENAVFEGQRQLDVSFIVAAHIVHILDMNQVNGCGNGHILQDVVFSFQPDIECV